MNRLCDHDGVLLGTAAGLLLFSRHPADMLLMEVGLGGRLDATNVVEPLVACLTPIGLEHQEYLGDTLALIAAEKPAILKRGAAAVSARQEPEVLAALGGTPTSESSRPPLTSWISGARASSDCPPS